MPRGDGTGPQGQGPLTGRGMGSCGDVNNQSNQSPALGQGQTFGQRVRSGFSNVFGLGQSKSGRGGRGQGGQGRGQGRGGGRGRNR